MLSIKKKVALLISLLLILILLQLFSNLVKKIQNQKVYITSIRKVNIISSPSANLKYFYEPKPNSTIKTDIKGEESIQTINADSLNETQNYSIEKPKNTFRIVTLGDSFTFGTYVNTKDNWPKVLENMLNSNLKCNNISKFEVINLGVEGYDTQYEVERFKVRGKKYDPDLVIWYFVDLLRLTDKNHIANIKDLLKIPQSRDEGLIAEKEAEIYKKNRQDAIDKLGIENILNLQGNQIELFRSYFSGKVIMVPRPELSEQYKNLLKKEATINNFTYYDNMRNYYDMDGSFLNAKINPNLHPNQKGHKIIAEDLLKYLKNSNIIDCQK